MDSWLKECPFVVGVVGVLAAPYFESVRSSGGQVGPEVVVVSASSWAFLVAFDGASYSHVSPVYSGEILPFWLGEVSRERGVDGVVAVVTADLKEILFRRARRPGVEVDFALMAEFDELAVGVP